MTKIDQNFTMWQGETIEQEVPVTDKDGNQVNVSNATAVYVIKESASTNADLVRKTDTDGLDMGSPTVYDLTINYEPADTESLHGKYYHECKITDASSNVNVGFEGEITINASGV